MKKLFILISMAMAYGGCTTEMEAELDNSDIFTKFYGTINSDEAFDMVASPDGGYVLLATNETELPEETLYKIHAIKIDATGNIVWDRLYPDPDNDINALEERINYAGRSIVNTDNGYMIVGDSIYEEELSDLFMMTINEEGSVTGSATISHPVGSLSGQAIERSESGNYVVLASILDNDEPENMYLTEINSNFQQLWDQSYGSGQSETISKSIDIDTDKISWVGTEIRTGNEQDLRFISTRPDSKNTYFDEKVGLNNGRNEAAIDLKRTATGYVVVGTTDNTANGDNDIFLVSLNNQGKELWSKTFGGPGDDEGNAVFYTSDNSIVALGTTESFGNGESDILLIKTTLSGTTIWGTEGETKTFGGFNEDNGANLLEAPDGGLFILGTQDFGDIGTIILIKTDKEGNL